MLGDFYDIEKSTKQLAKGVWETLDIKIKNYLCIVLLS